MTTRWRAWLAAAAMTVAGCSTTGGRGDASAGAPAACVWPSTLDPTDAGPDAAVGPCVAGRAYLSCAAAGGGGELCLSDDVTRCPVQPLTGETYGDCQDLCGPDEYAVSCGGPGPGPWPSPPDGCRTLPPGPGGGTVSCCPCATDGAASGAGGAGPAATGTPTFDCGGTTSCAAASEVCEQVAGGAPPGVDFSACIAMPPACLTDPSCDCALAQLKPRGATACSITSGGGLTVRIDVP